MNKIFDYFKKMPVVGVVVLVGAVAGLYYLGTYAKHKYEEMQAKKKAEGNTDASKDVKKDPNVKTRQISY